MISIIILLSVITFNIGKSSHENNTLYKGFIEELNFEFRRTYQRGKRDGLEEAGKEA